MGRAVVGLWAVGVTVTAATALAVTATGPIQVTILTPVAVETQQTMSFGGVLPPTAGAQTFTLDPAGGSLSPGDGDGQALGTPISAEFHVTGTPDQSLTTSATVTQNFGDPALSLADLTTLGGTRLDETGAMDILVGGTLTVGADVTPALHRDAVITVTVHYP